MQSGDKGFILKGFRRKGAEVLAKAAPEELKDLPDPQDTFLSTKPVGPTKSDREMFSKPRKAAAEAAAVKSSVPIIKTVSFLPNVAVPKETKPPTVKEVQKVLKDEYTDTLNKLGNLILEEETVDPYENEVPEAYVPESRKGFANFINFEYGDFALKPVSEQVPTPEGEKYPYQKFIREFMRYASPYRGILVYHGLGSGKTCTAIAASEALFSSSNKKIIVMTPFSLRKTFLKEITFCGFRHFRLQNYWIELDKTDPTIRLFARNVLNISENHLKKANHIWVPDFDQTESNYNSLSSDQQTEIREQILSILVYDEKTNPTGRIHFINYNGISAAKLKEIACAKSTYFDDAVIVIDEIHNVIRLMQGKLESYLVAKPKATPGVKLETIGPEGWKPSLCYSHEKYARGYLFYRLLLAAKNSKIIGLSGTPLINFPEELGILANILHGYIPIIEAVISTRAPKAEIKIEKLLVDFKYTDFVRVELDNTGHGIKVLCSLVPEGIEKITNDLGVQRIPEGIHVPSRSEILKEFVDLFHTNGYIFSTEPSLRATPLLPPFGEDFAKYFLDADRMKITNKIVLAKRLSGLVSYYKGSREDLMPKVLKDEVLRIPMSIYQQKQYMIERGVEIDKDKGKKRATVDVWAEASEIANMKNTTNYRMTSRQICNFAFPSTIVRPRAKTQRDLLVEEPNVKNVIDTVYDLANSSKEEVPEIPDDNEEETEENEETKETKENQENGEENEENGEMIDEKLTSVKQKGGQVKTMKEAMQARKRVQFLSQCKEGQRADETYRDAIDRSKKCLADDPSLLTIEGLRILSPKFAKILQNIQNAPGSSLVYSQFLDMEGIGIFRLAMDANDYSPIEILSTPNGPSFSETTEKSFRTNPKGLRYITFSGAEDENIRRLGLDVFNARFNELPENLSKVLLESGFKDNDNRVGQICRVLCITSAGAEGISLKNVRAVHIMEPYWNDVRLKQVKGRAIRIGSHLDLPEKDRNVSIYTYISVFGPEAQRAKTGEMKIDETIVNRDSIERKEAIESHIPIPDDIRTYTLTSDERLYVISERKKMIINDLETIMKSAAVDCELNHAENKDASFYCLKLEGKVGDYLYHPDLARDVAESESKHKIIAKVEKKVIFNFTDGGKEYSAVGADDKFIVYARGNLEKPLGTMPSKDGKPTRPITFN